VELKASPTDERRARVAGHVEQVREWVPPGAVHEDLGLILGELRATSEAELVAPPGSAGGLSRAEITGTVIGVAGVAILGSGMVMLLAPPTPGKDQMSGVAVAGTAPHPVIAPIFIATGVAVGVAGLVTGLVGRTRRKRSVEVSAGGSAHGAMLMLRGQF
jgi:hypothetical protein